MDLQYILKEIEKLKYIQGDSLEICDLKNSITYYLEFSAVYNERLETSSEGEVTDSGEWSVDCLHIKEFNNSGLVSEQFDVNDIEDAIMYKMTE